MLIYDLEKECKGVLQMKNIQRFIGICFLLLCILFLAPCLVSFCDVSAEEKESERLVVGIPEDRCPIFYEDPDTGEIVGIGVDLMRSAAEEAGYKAEFQFIEEETIKDALDNPKYDVIMPFGSAIKSTSGQESIVSDNLFQTPFTLLVYGNRVVPPMNKLRVGMLSSLGGGADTVRQLYPGIEIVFYDTMPEAVKNLRKGKVDALLHNSYVWSYVLQKPSYTDLKVQPSAMFSMDFRVGTLDTPVGRSTVERLNKGIENITDTYTQAVILDYTTRRLYRYDMSDYIVQYGDVGILVILVIVSVVMIGIFRQKNLKLQQEAKMRWLKNHDALTGALSLQGFRNKVQSLLREYPDNSYLLNYINIKNFKYINDSFGMKAGDDFLCFWINNINSHISDDEAVCRIESDHVAILRKGKGDNMILKEDAAAVDLVKNYFMDRGEEYRVQICSGIYVLTPEDYELANVDHMLDLARVAEKKVRETKKDGYGFYNAEQWTKGKRIAEIVSHLPIAISSGEIQVWYQPQVDCKTLDLTGMEALCRWKHPKMGWISPAEFIPELEESGQIFELDSYVWETVCKDLKRWRDLGIHHSASVNLSRSDIRDDRDIPGYFKDLIEKYELNINQLRIEITETAFAENPETLIKTSEKLREIGFSVEMDDFGSGYSSLHMLKEVSVDRIKLDMNFLTGSGNSEKGRTIVGYMIQMINSLGMAMIVEGVETAEQADFLLKQGCSDMQGYYFHKPMPAEDFEKMSLL